jgi:hypothetical protein
MIPQQVQPLVSWQAEWIVGMPTGNLPVGGGRGFVKWCHGGRRREESRDGLSKEKSETRPFTQRSLCQSLSPSRSSTFPIHSRPQLLLSSSWAARSRPEMRPFEPTEMSSLSTSTSAGGVDEQRLGRKGRDVNGGYNAFVEKKSLGVS